MADVHFIDVLNLMFSMRYDDNNRRTRLFNISLVHQQDQTSQKLFPIFQVCVVYAYVRVLVRIPHGT